MGCLSSPIFERAFDVCEQLEVRHAAGRGLGLFAKGAIRKGTVLFRELPLVCMQEASRTPCLVCERCCRFVGPLEAQIRALLRAQYPVDGSLPHVDGMRQLPLPEPCLGGCTMLFCSEACARAEYAQGHSLLCPGPAAATNQSEDQRAAPSAHRERGQLESMIKSFGLASGSSGASKSMVADAFSVQYHQRGDGKEGRGGTSGGKRAAASSAVEEEEGDGPQEEGDVSILDSASSPLERFERHARATNPIFLLAAKAMAGVIVQCNSGVSLEAAMQAYPGPPWWDAVPPPTGHDAVAFCETLRRLVTQSWLLLCAVLTRNQVEPTTGSGNSAVAAFSNPTLYATIVGSFERRNCALAVSSPVEEYFLRVDAMAEGPAKAAATAATAPLLESLGSRYRTHCEGSGLFTAQAILNHSCEPNVTLLKPTGEDEHDCRVVASLLRDVEPGEELMNSYVDVALPLGRRRRELLEYGFTCTCVKCEQEEAAEAAAAQARDVSVAQAVHTPTQGGLPDAVVSAAPRAPKAAVAMAAVAGSHVVQAQGQSHRRRLK